MYGVSLTFVAFKIILGPFGALVSKWTISQNGCHKVKWNDICDSGLITHTYKWGCLWPCSIEGHFGTIRCKCLKLVWCDIWIMLSFASLGNVPSTAVIKQIIQARGPLAFILPSHQSYTDENISFWKLTRISKTTNQSNNWNTHSLALWLHHYIITKFRKLTSVWPGIQCTMSLQKISI